MSSEVLFGMQSFVYAINFNKTTARARINDYIPKFYVYIITYLCSNLSAGLADYC